jgi:hypothetical protein
VAAGWARTYTVQTAENAGLGSLRWAINQANTYASADTIRFAAKMKGQTIFVSTPLPALTNESTVIDGDVDDDGAPDVALDGHLAGKGADGLLIRADHCTIEGLAIIRFPNRGVGLEGASHCTVRGSYVGTALGGMAARRNGGHQIAIVGGAFNTIGGVGSLQRNIVAAGSASPWRSGVYVRGSTDNHIQDCYIGVARDGLTALTAPAGSGAGVTLVAGEVVADAAPGAAGPADRNRVGGDTAGRRNVIGGVTRGIDLAHADANIAWGNYIGVGRDGSTALPMGTHCVYVEQASQGNRIGWNPCGNVLAGAGIGVELRDADTSGNWIDCNYFGLTAAGTSQTPLAMGVACSNGAGAVSLWGNYICPNHPEWKAHGVLLAGGGAGSNIEANHFGIRGDGEWALPYQTGVTIASVPAVIRGNVYASADTALYCLNVPAGTIVFGNEFQTAERAIWLLGTSQADLGDVGNSSLADEGWNNFWYLNVTWFIWNDTANDIKAEGNIFGSTTASEIDAKIYDKLDAPSRGRVDYVPLYDGVIPTSRRQGSLAVVGAAATPTGQGTLVRFSLSAPAYVTVAVRNLSGRVVATLCRSRACVAGATALPWAGQSDSGSRVPNGAYLVEIKAGAADGQAARALAALSLSR